MVAAVEVQGGEQSPGGAADPSTSAALSRQPRPWSVYLGRGLLVGVYGCRGSLMAPARGLLALQPCSPALRAAAGRRSEPRLLRVVRGRQSILGPRGLSLSPVNVRLEEIGTGASARVRLKGTLSWAQGGQLVCWSPSGGRSRRVAALDAAPPSRVVEVVCSQRQAAWLVFFEPLGSSSAPDQWTLVLASREADAASWAAPGCSGCFLGPEEEHFAVLACDRASVQIYDTVTTTGELPPLMTLRFPGRPASAIYPGPGAEGEQLVWCEAGSPVLRLSQPLIAREPTVGGASPRGVVESKRLVLGPLEEVLQVQWQDQPSAAAPSALVVTSERVLVLDPNLQVRVEHRLTSPGATLAPPVLSSCWLGPCPLLLFSSMDLRVLDWRGSIWQLRSLGRLTPGARALLVGAAPDRAFLVSGPLLCSALTRGHIAIPRVMQALDSHPVDSWWPSCQVLQVRAPLLPAIVLGWTSMHLAGLLDGGRNALEAKIRPWLEACDPSSVMIGGSAGSPEVLEAAIRGLAEAGLGSWAAPWAVAAAPALGDRAAESLQRLGAWDRALAAAIRDGPGQATMVSRAAAKEGAFFASNRALTAAGQVSEAILRAAW